MIEPIMLGSVIATSIFIPVILRKIFIVKGCAIVPSSVISSVILSHLLFSLCKPDYHFGPAYSIAIVMYSFISLMVVFFIMSIVGLMGRNLPP